MLYASIVNSLRGYEGQGVNQLNEVTCSFTNNASPAAKPRCTVLCVPQGITNIYNNHINNQQKILIKSNIVYSVGLK